MLLSGAGFKRFAVFRVCRAGGSQRLVNVRQPLEQ